MSGGSASGPRSAAEPITSWRVLAIAAPVALSNASVALQGAADTAVIGNTGSVAALAGVGLGAEMFALLLGGFNFLQIGVSGLSAQALGAHNPERVTNILLRGLMIGLAIAATLIVLQWPLMLLGLALFEASAETEGLAGDYFSVRIWGAPAELMNYALLGWFAGQEMTRRLFQHQLVLSLSNIALNILFVLGFGWGVEGVALATVIASVLGVVYGLWLARARVRLILPPTWRPDPARLLKRDELVRMMTLNRDIFIRTILLVGAFAWVARLGSLQGDDVLAANVVLFQFFMVSAFALDGFAIAAETLVGQAIGARDPRELDRSAMMTSLMSGLLSIALAGLFVAFSGAIIDLFTTAPAVRALARDYMLWAALIPVIGFAAFQLDGIFVGATASAEMRNSMIVTSLVFYPLSYAMMLEAGNHGLWASVWIWLALRALFLLAFYPRVRARATAAPDAA